MSMDYKEKYEAIVGWLKKYADEGMNITPSDIRISVPELAESEDERIRKSIILLLQRGGYMSPEDKDKAYAWLEKQKVQPTDTKTKQVIKAARRVLNNWLDDTACPDVSGDFAELEYAIREYDGEEKQKEQNGSLRVIKDASEWEKIKEQKPAESDAIKGGDFISDGKRVFLVLANVKERNLREAGSAYCESLILGVDGVVYCNGDDFKKYKRATSDERAKFIHDLNVGVKLKEQPAWWSEEDEKMLSNLITHIKVAYSSCDWLTETVAWLKSLRPQPEPEWSEGTKKALNEISEYLKYKGREEDADFIRNLCPLPHWKPSEEQMEALKDAVKLYKETHFERFHTRIESLYEQLKSL